MDVCKLIIRRQMKPTFHEIRRKYTLRFYYENCMGDSGYFTLKKTEIPKAIMSAWNIEADLNIVYKDSISGKDVRKIIFAPMEGNECNNDWLKEFDLCIVDGEEFRELRYISTGELAWQTDNYDGIVDLL